MKLSAEQEDELYRSSTGPVEDGEGLTPMHFTPTSQNPLLSSKRARDEDEEETGDEAEEVVQKGDEEKAAEESESVSTMSVVDKMMASLNKLKQKSQEDQLKVDGVTFTRNTLTLPCREKQKKRRRVTKMMMRTKYQRVRSMCRRCPWIWRPLLR